MKNIKLIPTLITIPAVILLLYLSYWQFQRLAWKEDLIAKINQQIEFPVVDLANEIDIDDMLYRKVKVDGKFLHEHEVHVYAGNTKLKGGNGYYILTPLVLNDNRIVIVNRGWVPENLKNSDTRPKTLIKDESEIIGAIMKTEEKGLYTHDNQPKRNIWFYINLAEIADHTNLAIEPFYILAQEEENSVFKGQNIKPNLLNNHLGYALTWLSAAISLAVIYVLYHRKK